MPIDCSREYAEKLSREDPLGHFRDRFYVQPGTHYMDGNSLGLLSRDAEQALLDTIGSWKTQGIDGWMRADPPWFFMGEQLGARQAALFGAQSDEIVVAGTTTVNLHALVATFYRPVGARAKIVATELDFPSDVYALQAHISRSGGDPASDLVKIHSRDGRIIEEDDIIAAMTSDVALVVLPSVLYRSGQLLDMQRLTAEANARGIPIGFDCAHSAGVIPHAFSAWGVDFALWCNYKYLNSGPGSVGGLYVNRKHFGAVPKLPGWWGYQKERQFDMLHEFEPAHGAGAWQISTINVLSAAPIVGSLNIVDEAGIERIRAKSLALTDYLIALVEAGGLTDVRYGYRIGTPLEHARRGGHVALEHANGPQIARALKARGVVPDFRPPNVVRLAPVPLYSSFVDVWETVRHLREIVDTGEFHALADVREVVA
ncbi:MAG TPA: kynureninase [Thermomicrobiales bacterium]|nr:kynureninase [Thermomicrobiales bacterium]